jgi:hypothetical protein
MLRKLLFALTIGLLAVGASATVASATLAGATATLSVEEAHAVGECQNGQQQFDIVADLTVQNNTGGPLTLASAEFSAQGDSSTSGPFDVDAQVDLAGTLTALYPFTNAVVANGDSLTIQNLNLTTLIPCNATNAEICVVVSVLNPQASLDESCAPFISDGVVIPTGTIGLLGLAALIGVTGLFVVPRMRRRRQVDAPLQL